jgi:hypothetical protein
MEDFSLKASKSLSIDITQNIFWTETELATQVSSFNIIEATISFHAMTPIWTDTIAATSSTISELLWRDIANILRNTLAQMSHSSAQNKMKFFA